ncbi:hypothetical protein [Robbsia sp. KACC 23696]|uniref:hypothetical protein n=1 Tax=Robbsia sp. KACC 23696 TaxID=3149231 RepID=UPI00325B89F8
MSDGALVFRVETNDEFGDSPEYTTYRIHRHERADGSLVDVMIAGQVSDQWIRRAMG